MNFGSRLREARERRGVSLRQIATATRISLRTLEALENNEIGKLPGGIFSRAFVRSYAHEVGLDPDETVRDFVHHFPLDHVTAGSASANAGDVASGEAEVRRRHQVGLMLTLAIVIPIAALVIYFLVSGRRSARAAESAIETPVSAAASQPVATAPVAAPLSPAASSAAFSSTTLPAANLPHAAGASLTPASAATAAVTPIAANEPLRLRIAPDGPCWVRVSADGAVRHQALMQKGDVYSQEAKDGFDLVVGDAGTFQFSINNRSGRRLGGRGEVVAAHIKRADLQTWLQSTSATH